MGISDILQQILGGSEPGGAEATMASLAAASGGAAQAAPSAGAGAPAATTTPGQAAPPPAGPTAPSPPDLSQLYGKMLDQARRDKGFNDGLTMIAAGFASPQSRTALLNGLNSGGSGGTDPTSILNNALAIQKYQADQATKAATQRALPGIAARYNIPLTTAQYLAGTGKLDEVLSDLTKPHTELKTLQNGETVLANTRDGSVIKNLGGAKEEEPGTDVLKNLAAVNADRAAKGQPAIAPEDWIAQQKKGESATGNMKELAQVNAERAAKGQPAIATEDWIKSQNEQKNPNDQVLGAIAGSFGKTYEKQYEGADAAHSTIQKTQDAHNQLDRGIIAGAPFSPQELATRKFVGQVFGIPDDRIANTESFSSAMKEIVLPKVKALGSGTAISDADRRFVDEAVGGNLQLDPVSMKRILTLIEKNERGTIRKYNDDVAKLVQDNPKAAGLARGVELPAPSKQLLDSVDPKAVEILRQRPDTAAQFDQRFGRGMSRLYLQEAR